MSDLFPPTTWPHWLCPCGSEPPKPGSRTTPVATLVSLREPSCPFCGLTFAEEYRVLTQGSSR
jgi:hypothetical protein